MPLEEQKYYAYQYLRGDMTPYYIGKGKDKRMYCKQHAVHLPANKSLIQIIAHRLSEHEARLLERKLIKLYGRKDLGDGILRNRTDGGGGISGCVRSKEFCAKLSARSLGNKYGSANKGQKRPNNGQYLHNKTNPQRSINNAIRREAKNATRAN